LYTQADSRRSSAELATGPMNFSVSMMKPFDNNMSPISEISSSSSMQTRTTASNSAAAAAAATAAYVQVLKLKKRIF
jgi:mevalonate pyrophosphate decarboxylase